MAVKDQGDKSNADVVKDYDTVKGTFGEDYAEAANGFGAPVLKDLAQNARFYADGNAKLRDAALHKFEKDVATIAIAKAKSDDDDLKDKVKAGLGVLGGDAAQDIFDLMKVSDDPDSLRGDIEKALDKGANHAAVAERKKKQGALDMRLEKATTPQMQKIPDFRDKGDKGKGANSLT